MMRNAILFVTCAALLAPSIAMARRGNEPPRKPPSLERHGRAVVNAACSYATPAGNGLVSCSAGPLVAIPANPPTWLTTPCFYLTDFTAANFGSNGADVIALNDGKNPATTKLVYSVAQGATIVQTLQSPMFFAAGLNLSDTNATSEVVAVSGFWDNCPAQ
jgi:hypothetical protein